MKISCPACNAKYRIPDERVKGKNRIFKVKCKKCGAAVRVRGLATETDLGRQTMPFNLQLPEAREAPPQRVWFAGIDGKQVGPLTEQEMTDHLQAGRLGADDLIWRKGFSSWTPVAEVDRFQGLVAAPADAGDKRITGQKRRPRRAQTLELSASMIELLVKLDEQTGDGDGGSDALPPELPAATDAAPALPEADEPPATPAVAAVRPATPRPAASKTAPADLPPAVPSVAGDVEILEDETDNIETRVGPIPTDAADDELPPAVPGTDEVPPAVPDELFEATSEKAPPLPEEPVTAVGRATPALRDSATAPLRPTDPGARRAAEVRPATTPASATAQAKAGPQEEIKTAVVDVSAAMAAVRSSRKTEEGDVASATETGRRARRRGRGRRGEAEVAAPVQPRDAVIVRPSKVTLPVQAAAGASQKEQSIREATAVKTSPGVKPSLTASTDRGPAADQKGGAPEKKGAVAGARAPVAAAKGAAARPAPAKKEEKKGGAVMFIVLLAAVGVVGGLVYLSTTGKGLSKPEPTEPVAVSAPEAVAEAPTPAPEPAPTPEPAPEVDAGASPQDDAQGASNEAADAGAAVAAGAGPTADAGEAAPKEAAPSEGTRVAKLTAPEANPKREVRREREPPATDRREVAAEPKPAPEPKVEAKPAGGQKDDIDELLAAARRDAARKEGTAPKPEPKPAPKPEPKPAPKPEPKPEPKPAKAQLDDIDKLLAAERAKKAAAAAAAADDDDDDPPAKPSGDASSERLSRKVVNSVASRAKQKVMRCYFMHADVEGSETLKVELRIAPDGTVIDVRVKGSHARDQVGACVTAAVKELRFPRSPPPSSKHYVRYTVGG